MSIVNVNAKLKENPLWSHLPDNWLHQPTAIMAYNIAVGFAEPCL